ncbi:MAG TPA: hypothetical protein VL361_10215 [Candidatus Limnocylindrales bacterium]|jgi:hypothetical protein|nr:hypothetical protein [Candidatus Limnocylindrales bacterium]
MIRPLRQRHRVMIFTLSVVVPATFAIGIATRKALPALSVTAPGFSAEAPGHKELWSRDGLWEKKAIRTYILNLGAGNGQLGVELIAQDQIARADVLVYWLLGQRKIENVLPDDAILLGSFDPSIPLPLALPQQAANNAGRLLLYSLGDHEIVAVSKAFLPHEMR